MFTLYEQYLDKDILGDGRSFLVYSEPEVALMTNTNGAFLLTSIDAPLSWSSPFQVRLPYFYSPDSLHWFSAIKNWASSTVDVDNFGSKLLPSLKSIELFARRTTTGRFIYLGSGSISGYGPAPADPRCFLVRYHIKPQLRRETWVSFGGYAGWLLIVGQRDFSIFSTETGATLVEEQWGKVSPYLRLTRYEGDILQAATNDQGQAVVSYLENSATPERFSGHYDPAAQWVCFVQENGSTWEVPVTTVISRNKALSIIKSYLSMGRPIGINGIT